MAHVGVARDFDERAEDRNAQLATGIQRETIDSRGRVVARDRNEYECDAGVPAAVNYTVARHRTEFEASVDSHTINASFTAVAVEKRGRVLLGRGHGRPFL